MSRESRIAVAILTAALVALSVCAVPSAMAKSPSQALRFNVIKRTSQYVVVKGQSHRFAVRRGAHRVTVRRVGRFKVIKRTQRYVVLRTVKSDWTPRLTITTPNNGDFVTGSPTRITWKMSSAASAGYFRVSMASTMDGAWTSLTASLIPANRRTKSYSVPWGVSQPLGTYRLWVYYYSSGGAVLASDMSDGTVSISAVPTATPTVTPTATPTPASNPIAAIQVARAGDTVYVGSGTFTGSVIVPSGVTIVGAGSATSWLKGKMTFGSDDVVRDLKIGDTGMNAVRNGAGATNTSFERCRFRGGGGASWTYVVNLGSGSSCDRITFKDCEIERNLGVEVAGADNGFNNVSIWCDKDRSVSDITFEGCHMGVSNGVTTGSPRMGLECFNYGDTVSGRGWKNVTLRNCVFEATDGHSADFSDQSFARATGLLIEGCTFKGGGLGGKWGWTLDLEMPLNPIIRNNTFYRGTGNWGYILAVCDRDDTAYRSSGAIITGNVFDLDANNGVAPVTNGWPILFNGYDNQFTGNTVNCHYGTSSLFMLDHAYRSMITGNTLNIGSRPLMTPINGSSGNTVSPNTVN